MSFCFLECLSIYFFSLWPCMGWKFSFLSVLVPLSLFLVLYDRIISLKVNMNSRESIHSSYHNLWYDFIYFLFTQSIQKFVLVYICIFALFWDLKHFFVPIRSSQTWQNNTYIQTGFLSIQKIFTLFADSLANICFVHEFIVCWFWKNKYCFIKKIAHASWWFHVNRQYLASIIKGNLMS